MNDIKEAEIVFANGLTYKTSGWWHHTSTGWEGAIQPGDSIEGGEAKLTFADGQVRKIDFGRLTLAVTPKKAARRILLPFTGVGEPPTEA